MNGWILLHKKIFKSKNFANRRNKANLIIVWIWLLTHCDQDGVVTVGRDQVAKDLDLHPSSVKRCFEHFNKNMPEVTTEPTNSFTRFTFKNWEKYQRKRPGSRPTSDQQVTTNKELKNKERIHICTSLLNEYNQQMKTEYSSIIPLQDNISYWLEIYSPDDIKKAIANIKHDDFWKKNITPEKFFRQRNQRGEKVDRIGEFLNKKKKVVY